MKTVHRMLSHMVICFFNDSLCNAVFGEHCDFNVIIFAALIFLTLNDKHFLYIINNKNINNVNAALTNQCQVNLDC